VIPSGGLPAGILLSIEWGSFQSASTEILSAMTVTRYDAIQTERTDVKELEREREKGSNALWMFHSTQKFECTAVPRVYTPALHMAVAWRGLQLHPFLGRNIDRQYHLGMPTGLFVFPSACNVVSRHLTRTATSIQRASRLGNVPRQLPYSRTFAEYEGLRAQWLKPIARLLVGCSIDILPLYQVTDPALESCTALHRVETGSSRDEVRLESSVP